jgi:hypothetical protein
MTTRGTNNSYLNKKIGELSHIPPFPLEIDDKIVPVVVTNPSFYPAITSQQYRGIMKVISVDVVTTGIGTDDAFIYVPDGHMYKPLAVEYILISGTATLTYLIAYIGDTATNEIEWIYSSSSSYRAMVTSDIVLPEVCYIKLRSVISAEVSPATYRMYILVQDWTTEDQKTTMREGLF